MAQTLTKIEPQHADMTKAVPPDAEAIGVTPDNRIIYRWVRPRSRGVPEYERNDRGEPLVDPVTGEKIRKWRRALNGDKLYRMNRIELYNEELIFTLESEGNMNIRMVPYNPPSQEELEAAERRQQILAAQDDIAAALVDRARETGRSVADLVAELTNGHHASPRQTRRAEGAASAAKRAKEVAKVIPPPPSVRAVQQQGASDDAGDLAERTASEEWPKRLPGVGRWQLSNGDVVKGKKVEAVAAQEELDRTLTEAQAEAASHVAQAPEV